jgi:hypothetical protein
LPLRRMHLSPRRLPIPSRAAHGAVLVFKP